MAKFGRTPATFHAALARHRQHQKVRAQFPVAHAVLSGISQGVILPGNPRTAAGSLFTGVAAARSQARAARAIRETEVRAAAAARAAEEDAAYLASFADPRAAKVEMPDPRSTRPPRPAARRYDEIKGGEPV